MDRNKMSIYEVFKLVLIKEIRQRSTEKSVKELEKMKFSELDELARKLVRGETSNPKRV